jgi:hypothetical protein
VFAIVTPVVAARGDSNVLTAAPASTAAFDIVFVLALEASARDAAKERGAPEMDCF